MQKLKDKMLKVFKETCLNPIEKVQLTKSKGDKNVKTRFRRLKNKLIGEL